MRITTTMAKVTYVIAWAIVGLVLLVLLLGLSGWRLNLITSTFTSAVLIVGVRTFRGRREPVSPARAWWRATGGWVSSVGVGTLLAVLGAACWWATAAKVVPGTTPFTNPLITATCLVAAVFYLHSGWRLARQGNS